jgi:hypothetical protein
MIMNPPEKIPADPRPAIERPTMKDTELGAAPHRAEPTSKIPMQTSNTWEDQKRKQARFEGLLAHLVL